ncbi:MAG: hypothetical protein ACRC1D_03525 [Culicoidibacterales bacterium]
MINNKEDFKKVLKAESAINVLKIKSVKEKGNQGLEVTFSRQLSPNTVSTKEVRTFWNQSLQDVANNLN